MEASSLESLISSVTGMIDTVSLGIAAIAAISLLVGGIGVMNIMLVSITERTREIGTRKALGAPASAIRMQFITESVILCLIGGFIGIVLGLALGYASPDAWIARYNVARYQAGTLDAIDVEYLGGLSADAIPELIALLDSPDEAVRTAAARALDWKREIYCAADAAAPDGFRAWNRSRNAARTLLAENSPRIDALLASSPPR